MRKNKNWVKSTKKVIVYPQSLEIGSFARDKRSIFLSREMTLRLHFSFSSQGWRNVSFRKKELYKPGSAGGYVMVRLLQWARAKLQLHNPSNRQEGKETRCAG